MEPTTSTETTNTALLGASGTIDKALFSDLEAIPACAILNSQFVNASGDVCVLYDRTILQGLNQWLPDDNGYVHGTFYSVEAFRPTVDKWGDGVPAVFGKRHPDPHEFEYNQILALSKADARIAGSSRTAELVDKNTGKPHIRIGLNICDAEANRLWEAGKLGISSAFLCTQTPDGKYIVGNVRPNHIFLFERDPLTGKEQRDMAAAVNSIEPVVQIMEEIMEEAQTNIGKELSSRNIGRLRGVLDDLRAHNSMVNRVCGRLEDMLGLAPDGVAKVDLESLMKRAGEYDAMPKTSTAPAVETIPEVPVVPMPAPQENTLKEGVSVVEPETKPEEAKENAENYATYQRRMAETQPEQKPVDVSRPMPSGTTVKPAEPPPKSFGGGGAGGWNATDPKSDEELEAESKGETPEEEAKEPDKEELVETPAEEEEEKKEPKIACKGKSNMSDAEIDELVTAKVNAALAQRATEEDKAAFVNSLKPGHRKDGDALYAEYRNAPFLFQQKHANKLAIGGETNLDGAQFIGAERGDKATDSPLSDAAIAGKANTLGVRLATDSTRVGESTVGRCVYNAEKNAREWVPLGRFVKE